MKQTYLFLFLLVVVGSPFEVGAQRVKDYSYYFEKGNEFLGKDSGRLAKNMFDTAIALNPKKPDAYLGRGWTQVKYFDTKEGLKDYDSAILITDIKNKLSLIEKIEHQLFDENPSKYFSDSEILKVYNSAIAFFPDSAKVYIDRSNNSVRCRKYKEAIADIKKAISINPNPSNYYKLAVIMQVRYRDFSQKQILKVYKQCVERNPNIGEGYLIRGKYYQNLAKNENPILDSNKFETSKKMIKWYNKAIADYDKAISIEPKTWEYYNAKLDCKKSLNICEAQEILKDYDDWIANIPENNYAYLNRANYHLNINKYKEAIADMDTAIMIGPSNFNLYINRAIYRCHLRGSNTEELWTDFKNMESLNMQKQISIWSFDYYIKLIKAYCESQKNNP